MANDYKHQEGWGTLFFNKNKTQENHPDFSGKALVDGEMKNVALWHKTKSGKEMYSVKIEKDTYVKPEDKTPF